MPSVNAFPSCNLAEVPSMGGNAFLIRKAIRAHTSSVYSASAIVVNVGVNKPGDNKLALGIDYPGS